MSAEVRSMGFPGRYIQGPQALRQLPQLLEELGACSIALLADATVRRALGSRIDAELQSNAGGAATPAVWLDFRGECSAPIIADLAAQAGECDTIVALGGGKTIDTGKGISRQRRARLIIVPTIASNDSPTSRLIVLYDEAHRVAGVQLLARNPDVVLVDTEVIARAPARFFSAGMGDALSKTFEARQCHLTQGRNFFGTLSLPTARLFADRCYAVIVEHGAAALRQVAERHEPDESVERVIEATVLLSGVGFESGGLSLAHALVRGFSAHPKIGGFLHGEAVAFGTLVQLVAEGRPDAEITEHAELTRRLGLPVSFKSFGVDPISAAELDEIAGIACTAPYIAHLRPAIDAAGVRQALERADRIGSGR
jgi:glycerol dehydrogenase